MGKGENPVYQHFLLFPQCFLSFFKTNFSFGLHLFCQLQMLSISTDLKFCCLGKAQLFTKIWNYRLVQTKNICMHETKCDPLGWHLSLERQTTLQEKEKILDTRIFSFSPQCFQNPHYCNSHTGLCEKYVKPIWVYLCGHDLVKIGPVTHHIVHDSSFYTKIYFLTTLTVIYSSLVFYQTIPSFHDPEIQIFLKHCGKRRKCWK